MSTMKSRRLLLLQIGVSAVAMLMVQESSLAPHVRADSAIGSPVGGVGGCSLSPDGSFIYGDGGSGYAKIESSGFAIAMSIASEVNTGFWANRYSDAGFLYGGSVPTYPSTNAITRIVPSTLAKGASVNVPLAATAFAATKSGTKALVAGYRTGEATTSGTDGKLSVINLSDNSVVSYSLGDIQPRDIAVSTDDNSAYVGGESFEVGKGFVRGKIIRVNLQTGSVSDFYSSSWNIEAVAVQSDVVYAQLLDGVLYGQGKRTNTSAIIRVRIADGALLNTLTLSGTYSGGFELSPDGSFLYIGRDTILEKVNLHTFNIASEVVFSSSMGCFVITDDGTQIIVSRDVGLQKVTTSSNESQSVTFPSIPDQGQGSGRVLLSASASSGLEVSFESLTTSVCSIVDGWAVPLKVGDCTIRAIQSGGNGWLSANADRTFKVVRQLITFSSIEKMLKSASPVTLTATSSSGLPVSFESRTPSVCSIKDSKAVLVGTGSCIVRASQAGNSSWDAAEQVDQSYEVYATPPEGEPGVSITNGSSYTNTRQVKLNLVWPEYASEARISNDGGFAAAKTSTVALSPTVDWELDDSVKGLYTKVVYVRFKGVGIDATKTYQDDIILDTTSPVINSSTASIQGSNVALDVVATDDLSGVNSVEVSNGDKMVTVSYTRSMTIAMKDLGLGVSSASVHKSDSVSLSLRVKDNAGNWTQAKQILVTYVAGTTSTSVTTSSTSLAHGSSYSLTSVMSRAKVAKPSGGKVAMSGKTTICQVVSGRLFVLKAGTCKVTFVITDAKKKVTRKTVSLKAA